MPRKTKKQKQLASIRKLNQSKQISPSESMQVKNVTKEPATSTAHEERDLHKGQNGDITRQDNFFAYDLKKTLLLTILVFTLEFFLYYATMNNYLVNSLGF